MVENKAKPIDMQINNARREIIERNRVQLRAIVGAIITCGRQNIPLRGHRDDSQYYIDNDKENPGNFRDFKVRCKLWRFDG